MAKRKNRKKRRPPVRPGAPEQAGPQDRQGRKEQARLEREARIKRARRRQLLRRLWRAGIVLLVIAAIAATVWFAQSGSRRAQQAAVQAAERIGCADVESKAEAGRDHITAQDPPPAYPSQPATSGPHRGDATLGTDADLDVFPDPIDESLEPLAVHNLEHGYVFLYYRADGPDSLPGNVQDALGELARERPKVVLAPYPSLPQGTSLAFTAWNKLQTCPRVTDAEGAVTVAGGFIDRFGGASGEAPEPNAA